MITRTNPTSPVEPVDLYASIHQHLEHVERSIETELFSNHPFVNHLCACVGRYRGKMIRPALVLLSAQAVGDINDDHYTLAAVVEMVHLATLVHDDVLDDAQHRRQQPAVNATDGNVAAVLLGDYLISHAYHLCSSLDDQYAARTIAATTNTVCEGELLEIHHRRDHRLTEAAYFEIIRSKTASLIGTCCALGARYAHADPGTIAALQEFGIAAGLAFQIVDDILDLTGEETSTGKSVGLDLDHGSATLPIIHCLACAPPPIRDRLRELVSRRSQVSRRQIREWLDMTGSVEYAIGLARGFVDSGVGQLRRLPDSPARDSLFAMADFILARHY